MSDLDKLRKDVDNLESNVITSKIDEFSQMDNPMIRNHENSIVLNEDWVLNDDEDTVTKTCTDRESVVLLYNYMPQLQYKTITGVRVLFNIDDAEVIAVGIGDGTVFHYIDDNTMAYVENKPSYVPTSEEEYINGTHLDFMARVTDTGYAYGYSTFKWDFTSDELKEILINRRLQVKFNIEPSKNNIKVTIANITVQIYFENELQGECDVIENRLEMINLDQLLTTFTPSQSIFFIGDKKDDTTSQEAYINGLTSYINSVSDDDNLFQQDDFVPSGWSSTELAVESNKIVYKATRKYVDGAWSKYSRVFVYSDGTDGSEHNEIYEYIYKTQSSAILPKCPSSTPEENTAPSGWSVNYKPQVSKDYPYCYSCFRVKYKGEWSRYGTRITYNRSSDSFEVTGDYAQLIDTYENTQSIYGAFDDSFDGVAPVSRITGKDKNGKTFTYDVRGDNNFLDYLYVLQDTVEDWQDDPNRWEYKFDSMYHGWSSTFTPVGNDNPYEWKCTRSMLSTGHWSDWSAPEPCGNTIDSSTVLDNTTQSDLIGKINNTDNNNILDMGVLPSDDIIDYLFSQYPSDTIVSSKYGTSLTLKKIGSIVFVQLNGGTVNFDSISAANTILFSSSETNVFNDKYKFNNANLTMMNGIQSSPMELGSNITISKGNVSCIVNNAQYNNNHKNTNDWTTSVRINARGWYLIQGETDPNLIIGNDEWTQGTDSKYSSLYGSILYITLDNVDKTKKYSVNVNINGASYTAVVEPHDTEVTFNGVTTSFYCAFQLRLNTQVDYTLTVTYNGDDTYKKQVKAVTVRFNKTNVLVTVTRFKGNQKTRWNVSLLDKTNNVIRNNYSQNLVFYCYERKYNHYIVKKPDGAGNMWFDNRDRIVILYPHDSIHNIRMNGESQRNIEHLYWEDSNNNGVNDLHWDENTINPSSSKLSAHKGAVNYNSSVNGVANDKWVDFDYVAIDKTS